MSKWSKLSLLVGLISLIAYAVTHALFGRLNLDYLTLGAFALSVVGSIAFDRRLWAEFLTMRTTKHGMNMGLVIVLMVVGVVCVNYLAVKHNRTWDLTQEKANSLSDQTTKVLDAVKGDVNIKLFYRGTLANDAKQSTTTVLNLFKDYSGRVKVSNVNALVDEEQALEYLKDQPDVRTAPLMLFVEHAGKRIRVDEPIDEAQVTSALIRATRTAETTLYFVTGHGEHLLKTDDETGLSELDKALKDASYKTANLNLIDQKDVPADAGAVAIVGPASAYLDGEIEALRRYVKNGGRLLIALDPGQHHNLANLTKPLGIEFANTYVLSPRLQIQGGGPATILGRKFDPESDVTRNFPAASAFAVFPLVSELKKVAAPGLTITPLVQTDPVTISVTDPRQLAGKEATQTATLAMATTGKAGGDKAFEAVVFGDSDFVTNRALYLGVNRDLVLNTFARLTNQKDLLSIRPKLAKGTMLTLTAASTWIIVITSMMVPLILFVTALVIWYRRRGA